MNRIMEKSEVFKNIRTTLAGIFPDISKARIVIHDAGLKPDLISLTGSASEFWFEILVEAEKHNQVQSLLDAAIEHYPSNTALLFASEEFSRWAIHQQEGKSTNGRLVEGVNADGLHNVRYKTDPASDNLSNTDHKDIGIFFDDQGKSIISVTPTEFFDSRLRSAFPGIRGLHWFENPIDVLDRLEIFFRKPLTFDKGSGFDVTTDPIWWFRGFGSLNIKELFRTNEDKCVLDVHELLVKKIAVFHSQYYWQSFIYVETCGEQPIGIYSHSQEHLNSITKDWGYAYEEYAIFSGIPISRQCYDDGAAVIDGKVTDTWGAKLRIRYLTNYNFVIASKFSPINSTVFSAESQPLFDGILRGSYTFDNLLEYIKQLPSHRKDR